MSEKNLKSFIDIKVSARKLYQSAPTEPIVDDEE